MGTVPQLAAPGTGRRQGRGCSDAGLYRPAAVGVACGSQGRCCRLLPHGVRAWDASATISRFQPRPWLSAIAPECPMDVYVRTRAALSRNGYLLLLGLAFSTPTCH